MISKKFFIFILLLLSGIVNSSESEIIKKKERYDKLKIKNTPFPKSGKTILKDYDQGKISEADANKNSEKDAAREALVAKYEEVKEEITAIEKEIKKLKPSKPKKKKSRVIEKIVNVYDMFMNMLINDSKNQDASIQGNTKRLQSDIKSLENKRNSLKAKLDQIKLEIAKKEENEELKERKNRLIAKEKADADKAKAKQEKVRKAAPAKAKKYVDKQEPSILFPEIPQIRTNKLHVKSGKDAKKVEEVVKETIHLATVELEFDGEESRPTTAAAAAAKKYVVNEEKLQSQSKHRTVITAMNKDPANPKVEGNQFKFDKGAEARVLIKNDNQPKDKSKGK